MDHAYVSAKSNSVGFSITDIRMALMEIRMLLSAMILKYTWTGVPDKPDHWDEEMKPHDTAIIHPIKGKCVLKLECRE
jgi:hypothetical protein